MADIISSAGIMFNGIIPMVGTVSSTIIGTPVLLFFCLVPAIGLGVGLFKRLISVN